MRKVLLPIIALLFALALAASATVAPANDRLFLEENGQVTIEAEHFHLNDRHGAAAANYVKAENWRWDGEYLFVGLTDVLGGTRFEARARVLVDTTGPWSAAGQLRLVRGSHIILPRLTQSEHALAYFEEGGRIVFVIPWGEANNLSLVGTTDIDHERGPDDVRITADEVDYLLGIVKRLFPREAAEPVAAFSSLRPLLQDEASSPSRASREHRIWFGHDGVLHVAGGKYTTYRVMSEEAADAVAQKIRPALANLRVTAGEPLDQNTMAGVGRLRSEAGRLARVQVDAIGGLAGERDARRRTQRPQITVGPRTTGSRRRQLRGVGRGQERGDVELDFRGRGTARRRGLHRDHGDDGADCRRQWLLSQRTSFGPHPDWRRRRSLGAAARSSSVRSPARRVCSRRRACRS